MTGLYAGLGLVSLLTGCVLDNPKFGLDGTASTTEETSIGTSKGSEGSSTGTSGSETASGTTTTGEPTTGDPTTDTVSTSTSTAATITDGTDSTSGSASTTGDPTTDSEGSTGGMLCDEMDKIDVFLDTDVDGYGGGAPMQVCPEQIPQGYIEQGGDCNDGDFNVNPGATEVCDGSDNNCNGLKDEYSESNLDCDLIDDLFFKKCFLSEANDHFYYTCRAKRFPPLVNGICGDFAVADGAKSYHVKVDDVTENAIVYGLAQGIEESVSIGLRDTGILNQPKDHKWLADDSSLDYGQVFGMPPWNTNEPGLGEAWTQIYEGSGLWGDIGAGEARSFVCEAEPAI